MKFTLENFPDKGDDKYWFLNSDWISEFDYTKFNVDLGIWLDGFKKELGQIYKDHQEVDGGQLILDILACKYWRLWKDDEVAAEKSRRSS